MWDAGPSARANRAVVAAGELDADLAPELGAHAGAAGRKDGSDSRNFLERLTIKGEDFIVRQRRTSAN